MKHLCVLQVEHIPLHAADRAGRQAGHVVLVLVPLCFGEEFACAQQILVCQQILLRRHTRWRFLIIWVAIFADVVDFLATICRALWKVQRERAIIGFDACTCLILANVRVNAERRSVCTFHWSDTFSSFWRGHLQSTQIDLPTGRRMWHNCIAGWTTSFGRRHGPCRLTCRLRARIHADFVRIIIILLQIAYFPLHVKNDHILLKSAQVPAKMYIFYIHSVRPKSDRKKHKEVSVANYWKMLQLRHHSGIMYSRLCLSASWTFHFFIRTMARRICQTLVRDSSCACTADMLEFYSHLEYIIPEWWRNCSIFQ